MMCDDLHRLCLVLAFKRSLRLPPCSPCLDTPFHPSGRLEDGRLAVQSVQKPGAYKQPPRRCPRRGERERKRGPREPVDPDLETIPLHILILQHSLVSCRLDLSLTTASTTSFDLPPRCPSALKLISWSCGLDLSSPGSPNGPQTAHADAHTGGQQDGPQHHLKPAVHRPGDDDDAKECLVVAVEDRIHQGKGARRKGSGQRYMGVVMGHGRF